MNLIDMNLAKIRSYSTCINAVILLAMASKLLVISKLKIEQNTMQLDIIQDAIYCQPRRKLMQIYLSWLAVSSAKLLQTHHLPANLVFTHL